MRNIEKWLFVFKLSNFAIVVIDCSYCLRIGAGLHQNFVISKLYSDHVFLNFFKCFLIF